jgi:dephospho-CoA kinase
MTEEKFQNILSRQLPDQEKRRRADFIIDTSLGMENAEKQVDDIIRQILKGGADNARNHI